MSITAEQVIEAYKETGLKPRQDEWFGFYEIEGVESVCGCALTALVVKNDPKIMEDLKKSEPHEFDMEVVIKEEMGLSEYYINGFIRGFDGNISIEGLVAEDRQDMEKGYADGQATWKAVAEEFNISEDEY